MDPDQAPGGCPLGRLARDRDQRLRNRRQRLLPPQPRRRRGRRIPRHLARAVARSSRSLRGLEFSLGDVAQLEEHGVAHHLVAPREDLFLAAEPAALHDFRARVSVAALPNGSSAEAVAPGGWCRPPARRRARKLHVRRLSTRAENRAGAFFTNSIHGLRLRDGASPPCWRLRSTAASASSASRSRGGAAAAGS